MSILVVNNFCDSIKEIRLFDSNLQYPPYDLTEFTQFLFEVYEPGIKNPIIIVDNNNISISAERRGYSENIVNVNVLISETKNLVPNPSNSDRVREYRLFAYDINGKKTLLAQDCFYIEDSLMGR